MGGIGSGPKERNNRLTDRYQQIRVTEILAVGRKSVPSSPGKERQAAFVKMTEGDLVQNIRIEYTPCTYGGIGRPWFLCPHTGCGRRCALLYRTHAKTLYRCRLCSNLAYRSQRVENWHALFAKLKATRAKLGHNVTTIFDVRAVCFLDLPKPKWMRYERYYALTYQCHQQEKAVEEALIAWMGAVAVPAKPVPRDAIEEARAKYGEKATKELERWCRAIEECAVENTGKPALCIKT